MTKRVILSLEIADKQNLWFLWQLLESLCSAVLLSNYSPIRPMHWNRRLCPIPFAEVVPKQVFSSIRHLFFAIKQIFGRPCACELFSTNGLEKYLAYRDHLHEPYNRYRTINRDHGQKIMNAGGNVQRNCLYLPQIIIIVSALSDKDSTSPDRRCTHSNLTLVTNKSGASWHSVGDPRCRQIPDTFEFDQGSGR